MIVVTIQNSRTAAGIDKLKKNRAAESMIGELIEAQELKDSIFLCFSKDPRLTKIGAFRPPEEWLLTRKFVAHLKVSKAREAG